MGIKVRKAQTRKWPVTVKLLVGDDEGNVAEVAQTFVAHFKPLTEADRGALAEEMDKAFGFPEPAAVIASVRAIVAPEDGDPTAMITEIAKTVSAGLRVSQQEALERQAWYFGRVVEGWSGVAGDDGQPLAFAPEVLRGLITGEDGQAFADGLNTADSQIRYGVAPAKNSPTSPAPGAAAAAAAGEATTS